MNEIGASSKQEDREVALRHTLVALRKSHEELKSTQLQLIQAAKLESIGRLAAGVAHEVKNPLAIILTGLQFLRRRVKDPDPVILETLDDLEIAVRRANNVTRGLLDYAVATELRMEPVDLEELLDATLRLVHHEASSRRIRVEREVRAAVPRLNLDRTKIEQVLVNLLMNAIDAVRDEGTVTVRIDLRPLTRIGHGVGVRKTDVLRLGQTVAAIEVEDDGPGIPDAILSRLFAPFYTTKPAGKGVGLGLVVSRTIATLHGGTLWLENRAEGGARATLLLRAGEIEKGAAYEHREDPVGR